jgi:PIN domain nuclease of toxin-antitoxin system
MKILLDTHTVLWLALNSPKLSEKAKDSILNPANKKFVSVASAWEVAIKISLGKFDLPDVSEFFEMIDRNGFELLTIDRRHISVLQRLPIIHRDPFDRLLVATAMIDGMTILSADENIRKYDANWMW